MSKFTWDSAKYGATVAALLELPRLAELGPGSPVVAVRSALQSLDVPRLCQAGLWLYFDFLDESHEISQSIETADGSFWHAIMHRREPDPFNSKYWWRRVGSHPVLDQLREHAPSLGYDYTNPFDFVDFCEKVRGTSSEQEQLAKRVQLLEWQLLFEHCWRKCAE